MGLLKCALCAERRKRRGEKYQTTAAISARSTAPPTAMPAMTLLLMLLVGAGVGALALVIGAGGRLLVLLAVAAGPEALLLVAFEGFVKRAWSCGLVHCTEEFEALA